MKLDVPPSPKRNKLGDIEPAASEPAAPAIGEPALAPAQAAAAPWSRFLLPSPSFTTWMSAISHLLKKKTGKDVDIPTVLSECARLCAKGLWEVIIQLLANEPDQEKQDERAFFSIFIAEASRNVDCGLVAMTFHLSSCSAAKTVPRIRRNDTWAKFTRQYLLIKKGEAPPAKARGPGTS